MTKIDEAVSASGEWFKHDGVDMVLPGNNQSVIVVVTTVDPATLKKIIPDKFHGFQINFLQVNPFKI